MTQQHEAINADHCAAQWLCAVSPTPPHSSQRSNMHCPSPAAEQWRPLLLNVQELAMVKDMQERQNSKQMQRNVGKKIKVIHMRALYIIHSNLSNHYLLNSTPPLVNFHCISSLRKCGHALCRAASVKGESLSLAASLPSPFLFHTAWINTPVSLLRWHRRQFGLSNQSGITDTDLSLHEKQSGRTSQFEAAA